MSAASFDLPAYLQAHFPPLSWPRIAMNAVFYNWPIGLRFDLFGRQDDVSTVCARAAALYEATFAPMEMCIVAGGRFIPRTGASLPSRDLFSFGADHGLGLGDAPERIEVATENVDPDDAGTWVLQWVCRPARRFGYRRIFEGIANCDHGLEPWLSDKVYFLAPRKGVLFFMYDDRGLDIVAEERAPLLPLYWRFRDWLLDYDRQRMRATFNPYGG